MAKDDSTGTAESRRAENAPAESKSRNASLQNDDDDDSSEYDSDWSSEDEDYLTEDEAPEGEPLTFTRAREEVSETENDPESNFKLFTRILEGKRMKRKEEEEERNTEYLDELYDFPKDREVWKEEDLMEIWADAPLEMTKPGWDPVFADEEDWEIVNKEIEEGRDPGIQPFYVPYRKPYPVIPDDNYDVSTPKQVVEELDRIEEFLKWVSYIFPDGSTYEGTVWDDLAHGKGVYTAEMGLVRYEGEWFQNNMEGHGVVEVDVPDIEPIPGSKHEAKMRAEGRIISRDFMSPEDREWLEKDVEDHLQLTDGRYEVPWYENEEWVRQFGRKPEKGRYRYAGEWKHGRMHGCGVYEVNERTLYGRFYFGDLLDDTYGCDHEISALHAGLAEVAAAKARMFVNKPDGMVREERGPYNDPQHPYFYEEDDVWMAPGFINQFYEVPDHWKRYVHEIDQEREMWLNSFYKAPLRLPMPAELEYWWSKEETPEFVILNKEPDPDPEDPSKLIYTEDPVILHTPTGRIINFIEDEEHGVRLFWQPPLKEGEEPDPSKVQFLPLGFDEFYGREVVEVKQPFLQRFVTALGNMCKPFFDKLEKWTEEQKKASEERVELIEKELELIEAEICLEEAIEDMDEELKQRETEEQKKAEMGSETAEDTSPSDRKDGGPVIKERDEKVSEAEVEEDEEEEDEEDEDTSPSSFGSVAKDQDQTKNARSGKNPRDSPFSTSSLSFASCSLFPAVQSRLQQSFLAWKQQKLSPKPAKESNSLAETFNSVRFPGSFGQKNRMKPIRQTHRPIKPKSCSDARPKLSSHIVPSSPACDSSIRIRIPPTRRSQHWLHETPEGDSDRVLSLHTPVTHLGPHMDTGLSLSCDIDI